MLHENEWWWSSSRSLSSTSMTSSSSMSSSSLSSLLNVRQKMGRPWGRHCPNGSTCASRPQHVLLHNKFCSTRQQFRTFRYAVDNGVAKSPKREALLLKRLCVSSHLTRPPARMPATHQPATAVASHRTPTGRMGTKDAAQLNHLRDAAQLKLS